MKLNIEVTKCSKEVAKIIQELGGKITFVYQTPLTLRAHLKPEKFKKIPKTPMPPPKKVLKLEK